ncbi:hypothetical protein E8K88_01815 [Lampropedia aestuarii]|uniref:PilN domain-containing protein n=1 Tax=Lampropedia aestuarii TaxID=2562762 RepID=A0A4S5BY73_9BURK|nr:PilN domain-containing protein [Lampropedia aestuarii]THJ36035.1 hypothetical protein E8K88_01815 [Lampropedia aestuarii]
MSAPSSLDNQTPASPWVLFGIDLSTVGHDWLKAMRQLYQVAPLRWFELNPTIQVLRSDGRIAQWQSDQLLVTAGNAPAQQQPFTAVELPEDLILRRALSLPDLPSAQIHDAVALDLMSSSPFQADDIAWGYVQTASEDGVQIHSAFASRTQIAQYLDSVATQQAWPSAQSEIWVFAPGSAQPIIFQGYGETIAEQARNKRRLRASTALGLLGLLLIAAAITPTLQVRHQAIQAEQAYQQLQAQTSTLSEERAQFTKALDSVAQIKTYNEQRINPLEVLELLSELLPKDVSVIGLKIEGQSVELTAEADNAAAIIQALGELDSFTEVRTTRPVQQVAQANKERFTVEMRIAPGAFNMKFSEELIAEPEPAQETDSNSATQAPAATPAAAEGSLQNSADPVGSSSAVIGGGSTRRGQSSGSSGVAPPSVPPPPLDLRALPTSPAAEPPTAPDNADSESSNQDQMESEEHMEQDGDADPSLADEESQS